MLGVMGADGRPVGLMWSSPVTETVEFGATEDWFLHNTTEDAHPIHVHQVQFEVLGRGIDGIRSGDAPQARLFSGMQLPRVVRACRRRWRWPSPAGGRGDHGGVR